jgi:U3 small nucleolar RNA-associated protein 25
MGIKITRGQIKLFSDLLSSDIVVASPVALATKLAEERSAAAAAAAGRGGGRAGRAGARGGGRGGAAGRGGGRDGGAAKEGGEADFLSSIEVLVVERADVMLMQNWDHVITGARMTRGDTGRPGQTWPRRSVMQR